MIFNSQTYILFLLTVIGLYWMLPQKGRTFLIFVASLTFYAFWRVEFVSILLISTVTDYYVALGIFNSDNIKKKRLLLGVSLFINLGLLAFFKYLYFFTNNINGLGNLLGMSWEISLPAIILPLGISFYTFQTISYSIDVYRETIKPERNFILYADYVLFFPQLVAGPILRANEVIHQLKKKHVFDLEKIGEGLRRILMGLFLKVVLADNLAPVVESGFAMSPKALSAIDVWVLAFLFGFQIYFDFSAYSHIAIGSAHLMGIKLPENFNFPYIATSPQDFWSRWHISLSRWIRDYLFLPVSFKVSAKLKKGHYLNIKSEYLIYLFSILFSMYLCGLWHGAAWTFVIWGLYHAVLMVIFRLPWPFTKKFSKKSRTVGGWVFTLPLVMLGWVFFRAQGMDAALSMVAKVIKPRSYLQLGLRENTYIIAALFMIGFIAAYFIKIWLLPLLQKNQWVRLTAESAFYSIVIGFTFIFLRPIQQFIYFQF